MSKQEDLFGKGRQESLNQRAKDESEHKREIARLLEIVKVMNRIRERTATEEEKKQFPEPEYMKGQPKRTWLDVSRDIRKREQKQQ